MTIRFLHLFPQQLGLNGESGNLACLTQRLSWANIDSSVEVYDGSGKLPKQIDAAFIGSGTLAGALEALRLMAPDAVELRSLALDGVPILALGLGWEILGESVTLLDAEVVPGIGVFPSKSVRTSQRASAESYGFDLNGNLTTGYANHSAELELIGDASPWINLDAGFGNSSVLDASLRADEGIRQSNLYAARLNGPLLPLNPHLADEFLRAIADRSGFDYSQSNPAAARADGFALNARQELKTRLSR
jgi:CobQ-like glutamine amidotransferase family enzyme